MLQNHQSLQIVKVYQIEPDQITEWEDQVVLVRQIGKVPIEVERIDHLKGKIVQGLIIKLERHFVLDLQIEEGCKIDLECLLGPWVGQTVLIIDQGFRLA